ncbi:MAG: toll/interleukin-1 receptor domain-containing protein [Syntrophobacteraceae bacterium]
MKVFISWSGPLSHKIALILHEWLPNVIQAVEPFLSTEDIDKGSRWFNELSKELKDTKFSLVCLTPDSLEKPWILFEAGAAWKASELSRVWTLLIGLSSTDVKGPLAQFQATLASKDDMWKLVKSVNSALEDKALPENKLKTAFVAFWKTFEEQTSEAIAKLSGPPDPSAKRSPDDILEEVLTLCRSTAQAVSQKPQAEEGVLQGLQDLYMRFPSNPSLISRLAETAFPAIGPSHSTTGRSALNPRNQVIEEDDTSEVDLDAPNLKVRHKNGSH